MSIEAPSRTALGSGIRLTSAEGVIVRRLLTEMLKFGGWLAFLGIVIPIALGAILAQFTTITQSIWEATGHWPRWWLFAMAIALVHNYLPILVMHGVTRRAILRAGVVVSVLAALFWGGFMTIGHVVEEVIYGWLGWSNRMVNPHLFADGYDVLPMLAEYGPVFLAYLAAGVLVGGLYYRFGTWRGTLLLAPAMLPIVVTEALLFTSWHGAVLQDSLAVDRPAAPVLVVGLLIVFALAVAVIQLVLRDVPVHSKK
jgi:hypothetical protein